MDNVYKQRFVPKVMTLTRVYCSKEQARDYLKDPDFADSLSCLDLAFRTPARGGQKKRSVPSDLYSILREQGLTPVAEGRMISATQARYEQAIQTSTQDWPSDVKQQLEQHFGPAHEKAKERYPHLVPDELYLIHTTGEEEGGMAYVKHSPWAPQPTIVFPAPKLTRMLGENPAPWDDPLYLFNHELGHVVFRKNLGTTTAVFNQLGIQNRPYLLTEHPIFQFCRVTNPDSMGDYVFRANSDKLFMPMPYMDTNQEIELPSIADAFNRGLLRVVLVQVTESGGGMQLMPVEVQGKPVIVEAANALEYKQRLGITTPWMDIPDEVIAEHFHTLLIRNVDSEEPLPEPLSSLDALLRDPHIREIRSRP